MLVLVGFVLLALGYGFWSFLALAGGLPFFGAVLLLEALALGALAFGWDRFQGRLRVGLAATCALLEAAGLFLVPLPTGGLLLNAVIVAGLGIVAWRASLRPGAYVALAGVALMLVMSLLGGETFLLPGYLLATAGWATLSWRALRDPGAHASVESAA